MNTSVRKYICDCNIHCSIEIDTKYVASYYTVSNVTLTITFTVDKMKIFSQLTYRECNAYIVRRTKTVNCFQRLVFGNFMLRHVAM